MLNSIETTIITSMARTLFCMAWADWVEQIAQQSFPPGTKIEDAAPPTPPEVLHLAYYLAGRLIQANPNKHSLMMLFRHAIIHDGKSWAGVDETDPLCAEFGSDLAMMITGQGVSWFDDHAEFALKVPDEEWTHLHLSELCGINYPAANGKWQRLWASKSDGYWFLSPDGRLTRGDHSIEYQYSIGTPANADDGPIYVDMTKPATITENARFTTYNFHAFRKNGERCYFGTERAAAEWVFKNFPFLRPVPVTAGA